MSTPPCYDVINKQDCCERSATCHATCLKWKEYEQQRNAEYETKAAIDRCDTDGLIRTLRRYYYKNRRRCGSTYKERNE